MLQPRVTLEELQELAADRIGFAVGAAWTSVEGRTLPPGMISRRCRLAYVLFERLADALRCHDALERRGFALRPRGRIRRVAQAHRGRDYVGWAVVAVLSPDSRSPSGFWPAPPRSAQAGTQRRWALAERRRRPPPDRYERELQPEPAALQERDDELLERELDRLEAEYNAKLWWYGEPGRITKYPPALGSVQELFAYARRGELDIAEVARRNREREAERWLGEQRERERSRLRALAADQAEVAAALNAPRRGRPHAADVAWLSTAQALRERRALRYIFRDAGRPQR